MNRLIICTAVAYLTFCGCATGIKTSNRIPNDQVAFIEYQQLFEGKFIEGEIPPGPRIDMPTYSFSAENGTLEVYRNHGNIDTQNIKAILGTGKTLIGASGSGSSTIALGISQTPFNHGNITITEIFADRVDFTINGKSLSLKAGESWEDKHIKLDTIYLDSRAIIETTNSQRVVFHGLINKSNLAIN